LQLSVFGHRKIFAGQVLKNHEYFATSGGKQKDRHEGRSLRNSIKGFDQAAAFRFLRQPSKPSALSTQEALS
jgi:hypothetical protein